MYLVARHSVVRRLQLGIWPCTVFFEVLHFQDDCVLYHASSSSFHLSSGSPSFCSTCSYNKLGPLSAMCMCVDMATYAPANRCSGRNTQTPMTLLHEVTYYMANEKGLCKSSCAGVKDEQQLSAQTLLLKTRCNKIAQTRSPLVSGGAGDTRMYATTFL